MGELQLGVEIFPFWKAFLWCFYPISVLVIIELLARGFDDDDDQDGGMMIPAYQGAK
ncbi:hypothetical protein [Prochlorococcus marinus]|uniref:hypothetical protein n=1 Tax=Prochlorococcus marinus TaxID=1219 RepID=UPI00006729CB|nr:hypothetical protein [Prochlorococcus marinus]